MSALAVVALTAGEPAGIGPDLCALCARERFPGPLVVVGDAEVIRARAKMRGLPFDVPPYSPRSPAPVSMLHIPVAAPVQKSTINDSGLAFTGHTEYLAGRTNTKQVVMLLAGAGLRVALVTTHLALADVPRAITRERVASVLRVLDRDLRVRFGIANPRILVAGLNPHAGESGYLGREEIEVIAPVVEELAREGMNVAGPYPADTLFTPRALEGSDAQLAMYHDQGLAVLKHAAFGEAVNVTLGLPIIRTSVDHGTALDRAGRGEVDAGSLREAIRLAFELAAHGA
ncbi:MAG TPA: 4-hydroxythreonine-4-phosphate dehydrogenase PdxA [Usitatibacter sp.]|nr:4-hydroxythreonine-4-phosphate dehydrogenase PdxA [Usitatibacter sp.]